MGASTSFRCFRDSLGRETIQNNWKTAVELSLHEDGHEYSGEIGMLGTKIARWLDLSLSDVGAAGDYIADHHEKWNPAIAVSYIRNNEKWWAIGGWCSS